MRFKSSVGTSGLRATREILRDRLTHCWLCSFYRIDYIYIFIFLQVDYNTNIKRYKPHSLNYPVTTTPRCVRVKAIVLMLGVMCC